MKFSSKSDYVLDILKERILNGTYKQGESIVISNIASELEISSTPVREAIKRLESEGLVQVLPHKGAQVSSFDKEQIMDIVHIRAVLEAYAAATAIEYLDEKDLSVLRNYVEKMDQYAKELNDAQFTRVNTEFHRYIYERCPYPKFNTMIAEVWDGGNFTKSLFAYFPKEMIKSNQEHYKIIDAIKGKDAIKVEKIMREHKLKNIELYLQIK